MLDYMEYCLLKFYKQIDWSPDDHFTKLNSVSRALLDFQVPYGMSLTLGKAISPFLKSSWTLSQLGNTSVSFLYTSCPLDPPANNIRDEISAQEIRVLERVLFQTGTSIHPRTSKDHLLYGRVFEDGKVEGLLVGKLSRNVLCSISGYTLTNRPVLPPGHVADTSLFGIPDTDMHISSQLVHSTRRGTAELTYSSASNIFGVTGVLNIGRPNGLTMCNIGSEAYYAANERSGGMSVGARCTMLHPHKRSSALPPLFSEMLVTVNPVMGHLATAFTTQVLPTVLAGVRYDLNAYSFESDIGVSCELRSNALALPKKKSSPMVVPASDDQHVDQPQEGLNAASNAHLMKLRISPSKGVAFKIEGQYRKAIWSIGMSTDFGPHVRKMLGFSIQIGQ